MPGCSCRAAACSEHSPKSPLPLWLWKGFFLLFCSTEWRWEGSTTLGRQIFKLFIWKSKIFKFTWYLGLENIACGFFYIDARRWHPQGKWQKCYYFFKGILEKLYCTVNAGQQIRSSHWFYQCFWSYSLSLAWPPDGALFQNLAGGSIDLCKISLLINLLNLNWTSPTQSCLSALSGKSEKFRQCKISTPNWLWR